MVFPAVLCAERATDEKLVGPDWAINIELCDIIIVNPGQAKDALKIIKKRLGSKKPKIQLLALSVLDALVKNCGEQVIQQIIEREILLEMVKIVKKKPDVNVREQILILIDTWQEALGAKFPPFMQAYSSLRDAGVQFPLREDSSSTLFTPPQTQPIVYPSNFEDVAIQASLQENVSALSAPEMQTAQELSDVLMEMLGALDPNNNEGLNQELIVDLVEQCQGYQQRVLSLVNNTTDESLLFQGLALNDNLQRVLCRHEEISRGFSEAPPPSILETSAPPFIGMNHEEDESEDDFSQLAPRTQSRRTTRKTEPTQASSYVPPQPSSKKPETDANVVDYLSGDTFDNPFAATKPAQVLNNSTSAEVTPSSSSASPKNFHTSSEKQPMYDETVPLPRSAGLTPPAPWDPLATVSLPPPPAKYNQRQQFFEQHGGSLNTGNGSGSSHDNIVAQTQNMSLNSTSSKNGKSEDALFKDLVDFAKAKTSSSSSTPKSKRTY